MKRITILTAAFLCLFGLTESTEQNNQSSRNMEDLNLTQEWDKTFHCRHLFFQADQETVADYRETIYGKLSGDGRECTFYRK